ncbi:hypothetical protein ScPMuIL_009264 [Solemya velum]
MNYLEVVFFFRVLSQVTGIDKVHISCDRFREKRVDVMYVANSTEYDTIHYLTGSSFHGHVYSFENKQIGIYNLSAPLTGFTACKSHNDEGLMKCHWEMELDVKHVTAHTQTFIVSCDFILLQSSISIPKLKTTNRQSNFRKKIFKRSNKHHPEFISGVSTVCPPMATGSALVTAYSDLLGTDPVAVCKDGIVIPFLKKEDGYWQLQVYFEDNDENGCVFDRSYSKFTFLLRVTVPLVNRVRTVSEWTHTVSCVYDQIVSDGTKVLHLPPSESEQSPTTKYNITLYLADSNKNKVSGSMKVGDNVTLVATLRENTAQQASIRAHTCHVDSYVILEKGCGTGDIFGIDYGFWTQGTVVFSPRNVMVVHVKRSIASEKRGGWPPFPT